MSRATSSTVMPALGAGIHAFVYGSKVMDGRAKPGHDGTLHASRPKGGHDAFAFVKRVIP